MIYKLLYKLLHEQPDIRNRVGVRIFARRAPQGSSGEHIILKIISSETHDHLTNESGLAERIIQIDAKSNSASKASSLAELIRLLLSGYGGEVEILDPNGDLRQYLLQANLLSDNDIVFEPQDGSDSWDFQHSSDYQVFYEQDVPTHV